MNYTRTISIAWIDGLDWGWRQLMFTSCDRQEERTSFYLKKEKGVALGISLYLTQFYVVCSNYHGFGINQAAKDDQLVDGNETTAPLKENWQVNWNRSDFHRHLPTASSNSTNRATLGRNLWKTWHTIWNLPVAELRTFAFDQPVRQQNKEIRMAWC